MSIHCLLPFLIVFVSNNQLFIACASSCNLVYHYTQTLFVNMLDDVTHTGSVVAMEIL